MNEFGEDRVYLDQWVTFADASGQAFACIDAFVVGERGILLCECKLTWTPTMAWWQMEKRYAPILRFIFGKPVSTLQVCKNLARHNPILPPARRTPRYLFENPEPGRFTHHWLGR
ncbi:MAG: hypothetical protein B7Z37_03200 [Verrucomicrobia bacterium 12-59-8]|nr:MAG: hypothetical protein B7Z37_03200 [Verrucomicrobia bacterium 12-59-8]